jgi:hypothetical protein
MSSITISDLRPVGCDLFADDESYMKDLADNEFDSVQGGFSPFVYAGVLALESSAACVAGATAGLAVVGGVIGWTGGGK